MSAKTNYLENKLIDFLLRGQPYTPGPSTFLALFTSATSDSGGGTEVSGGGYARVDVPSTLASWAATDGAGTTTVSGGTGGQTSNNAAISLPDRTADWGVVTHFALFDAQTGGNMLLHGPLDSSVSLVQGTVPVQFAAGAIKYQEDN